VHASLLAIGGTRRGGTDAAARESPWNSPRARTVPTGPRRAAAPSSFLSPGANSSSGGAHAEPSQDRRSGVHGRRGPGPLPPPRRRPDHLAAPAGRRDLALRRRGAPQPGGDDAAPGAPGRLRARALAGAAQGP